MWFRFSSFAQNIPGIVVCFYSPGKHTRECLMVCVWVPNLHEEMDQNDYCGETRSG